LSAMGLIVGGNPLTSQSLGTNAKVTINGTEYLSTSNEVSDAQTGITGVTLNLKQVKTDADIDVLVDQDTQKLTDSINSVVTAFNTLIGSIDSETKADGGRLAGQNNIRAFRSQLRQLISSSTTGAGDFNSLGLVGISTARSNGQSANSTLTFNNNKFIEALKTSPDNVEALIKGANGIFTKMQTVIDDAVSKGSDTSGDKGLFQTINDSYDAFIRRSNSAITAGEDRLERRRLALQRQFAASDSLIAQFRSQGNALSGIAASLGGG
jgi:flagellar hook-associated protein 2